MNKHTTWRPDTCGCEVILAWDDADPDTDHTPVFVTPCPAHDDGSGDPVTGPAILAENRGKNRAIAALQEHAPGLKSEEIRYRFDSQRRLVLSAPLEGHRGAVTATLRAKLGIDLDIE